jgi:hypothetical protein
MAKQREVQVGFRDKNGKMHVATFNIPADSISGDNDAMEELRTNKELRTRFSADMDAVTYVQIGEPHEPWSGLA